LFLDILFAYFFSFSNEGMRFFSLLFCLIEEPIGAQQITLDTGFVGATDCLRSSSYALPYDQRKGVRMREQRLFTART